MIQPQFIYNIDTKLFDDIAIITFYQQNYYIKWKRFIEKIYRLPKNYLKYTQRILDQEKNKEYLNNIPPFSFSNSETIHYLNYYYFSVYPPSFCITPHGYQDIVYPKLNIFYEKNS